MSKHRFPLHRSQLTRPHLTGLFSDAFRPDWEPGLSGWWDASERMSLWDADTAGSLQTVDAGTIGRMEDLSGNGRHLAQPTAGERPALGASGGNLQNGLQTVVFDWGVGDASAGSKWLTTGAVAASTFFPTGTTAGTDNHTVFLVWTRPAIATNRINLSDNGGNWRLANSGATPDISWLVNAHTATPLSPGPAATTLAILMCRRIAGVETRICLNGGTETIQANTMAIGALSGGLTLPGNQTTFKQKMRFCEMAILTGPVIPVATLNRFGRYLANKWGGTWTNIP